jgi:DNA modification methylase
MWRIGNHLVLCGDATDKGCYGNLLGGEFARMVFTDPPYNVAITGHVCGRGKVQHDEFAMASGEMSKVEFTTFLARVFQNLANASLDGSLHYLCMDWRHMGELMAAASAPYSELKNLCVWNKTNAGMGALYRSQHELVFLFKKGTGEHINNVQLGVHGRNRSNVWTYAGINAFGVERDAELAMHPTVKPVAMVADAILDVTNPGDSDAKLALCNKESTMHQTATSKDWVRDLRNRFSSVIHSEPTTGVKLMDAHTGRYHTEPINVNCWGDEVFRRGYEDLAAEEGFIVV